MPTSHSKCQSTPCHQHEKVRAHHARPAAATLASSPPTCAIQDRCARIQGIARSPSCVSGRRLSTCVCHWTPTTAFVGHWLMPSAANQHMSWVIAHSLLLDLAYGTVCQPSCQSWTSSSDNFNEHSKRTYLVTDSCSAEWQCFSCAVQQCFNSLKPKDDGTV